METEAGIKGNTDARHEGVRRRDIDEKLVQHDVQASREAAGTSSPAMGNIDTEGNLAVQTQTRKCCVHVRTHLGQQEICSRKLC